VQRVEKYEASPDTNYTVFHMKKPPLPGDQCSFSDYFDDDSIGWKMSWTGILVNGHLPNPTLP
jgi:hypothetical protein